MKVNKGRNKMTKPRQTRQSLVMKGLSRMAQGKSVKRINNKLGKMHARAAKKRG